MTYHTTVGRSTDPEVGAMDYEVSLVVTYAIHRGSRGQRHDGARLVEPDDGDELEILAIEDEDGEEFPVSVEEESRIEADIWASQE